MTVPEVQRLSKLIAETGLCSRRAAEKWIASGRVSVNDEKITLMSATITKQDEVKLDGLPVNTVRTLSVPKLFAVNKVRGEVIANSDPSKNRPLLFNRISHDLIPKYPKFVSGPNKLDVSLLKPVTWLDYETEGLCLLTNSGKLARIMNDPVNEYRKVYRARIHGLVTDSKLKGLRRGIVIDGVKYGPMDVSVERTANTISWMRLDLLESKRHHVRTSMKALHLSVTRLILTDFGPYNIAQLLPENLPLNEVHLHPSTLTLYRKAT
jgi:23S rRNA pseudouridine2605 synthase